MKRIILLSLACTLVAFSITQAQEVKNVKKETTIKKVTVKDTSVETIVEEDVREQKEIIVVEDNMQTNQGVREQVVKKDSVKIIKAEEPQRNIENEESLEELRKEEERAMQRQKGIETHRTDTISSARSAIPHSEAHGTVKAKINK